MTLPWRDRRGRAEAQDLSSKHVDQLTSFSSAIPEDSQGSRRRSNAGVEKGPEPDNSVFAQSPTSDGVRSPYVDTTQSLGWPVGENVEDTRSKSMRETSAQDVKLTSSTFQRCTSSGPASPRTRRGKQTTLSRITSPWQHGIEKLDPSEPSHTVREFDSQRQRSRLFAKSIFQWLITVLLCTALAGCLKGFQVLPFMELREKHTFNALIVLFSILLGTNLSSSLREYAQMLRWRLLAAKYRSLEEFELLMQCDSQRKVIKLFWKAGTPGRFWPNKTQWLCVTWISMNLLLQILVSLLGLTYNLDTSPVMQQVYGRISICDLSVIRDIWGEPNPDYYAQLGSANYYGIQGQDYNFVVGGPVLQTANPTLYYNADETTMWYNFLNVNQDEPAVIFTTTRMINTTAMCKSYPVIEGGYGNTTNITYLEDGIAVPIDVVRTGPGAVTYISDVNRTCGPRCTSIMALQSAGTGAIQTPTFFKCNNTISHVGGVPLYIVTGRQAALYQMPDQQARIMAGAIGWSGFNNTPGDALQYVRYSLDTWWSPSHPTSAVELARKVMEFSIEAIAALDYNGPRLNVTGWSPIPAQIVTVQWRWAATILGVIPFIQFVALLCILEYANQAIIKDGSYLSTARLLRPLVEPLGDRGCLLTGEEIAEEIGGATRDGHEMKVMYGWREPVVTQFEAAIGGRVVRHVDVIRQEEGLGKLDKMPGGLYDGCGVADRKKKEKNRKKKQKRQ